jgi:Domain of unknown function (DUF4129)
VISVAQVVDPDAARADVREILGDRRFRSDPAPRPFRGPLQWLGDRLSPIGRWLGDVLGAIPWFIWLAIAAAVLGWFIAWIVRRAQRPAHRRALEGDADRVEQEDPAALERDADAAERAGDFERAVRLRFRAGLLRLGIRGAIPYRPSVTTTEVRTRLDSETFDQLAHTFEHVAYGREPAHPPDVADARRKWPRVLEESRKR